MAIDTSRKRVNALGFARGGAIVLPDAAGIEAGDRHTLLGSTLAGNDRWKIPVTHRSTYIGARDRSALVYDHASGTWLPVRLPIVVGSLVGGKATLTGTTSTTLLGSVVIPAALLVVGTIIRASFHLRFTFPTPASTFSTDLLLGGVAVDGDVIDGEAVDRRWEVEIYLDDVDASGGGRSWYREDEDGGASSGWERAATFTGADLSVDATLELHATLGNGADQLDVYGGHVEVIRP